MSEMVERVALAISGGDDPASILAIHRHRARAAIEAMREPTEGMVGTDMQAACGEPATGVAYIWQRLIDEALK